MQEIIEKNILDSKIVGRFEPRIYAFSTNTIPNHLKVGDTLEVFGPKTSVKDLKIEYIINSDNESVDSASHPQEKLKINMPFDVCEGDIVRVKIT